MECEAGGDSRGQLHILNCSALNALNAKKYQQAPLCVFGKSFFFERWVTICSFFKKANALPT